MRERLQPPQPDLQLADGGGGVPAALADSSQSLTLYPKTSSCSKCVPLGLWLHIRDLGSLSWENSDYTLQLKTQ